MKLPDLKGAAALERPPALWTAMGRAKSRKGLYVSPVGKAKESAERWIEALCLQAAMSGDPHKFEVYQAKRAADALEKAEPFASELVRLKAHLHYHTLACDVSRLTSFPKEKREKMLKELMSHANVTTWPTNVQAMALTAEIKSMLGQVGQMKNFPVRRFLNTVGERAAEPEFDPMAPRLADTTLSP